MSMNVGGDKSGPWSEMNVTPMIDVMLVLIVIFLLVSQSVRARGLEALVPQPNPIGTDTASPERTVVLQLADNGTDHPVLTINRQPVSWGELRKQLFIIYTGRKERVLYLKASDTTPFESVAEVIDVAHADFPDMRVGLMTSKLEAGR